MPMSLNFRNVIESLGDLPPTPVIAVKALQIMQDPNGSANKLAEIIARDPAVSARVLKTANSPLFYTGNHVATLNHAIVILGESHLRHLVLEASLRGINKHFGVYERMLWENSIGCAIAARIIANGIAVIDPEEAFLAGLFSNIGRIIMNNHSREQYRRIADAEVLGESASHQLEKELYQFTHAEIGAAVLDRWNFPATLVQCILHHHDFALPDDCPEEVCTLTATVNLASGICRHLNVGYRLPHSEGELWTLPGARALRLEEARLNTFCKEFSESFKDERAVYLA
ncbi:hypothetical protein C2E25_05540 [Geothermobacter hydrogeniphilus]|uniref:HDOD domain-containing protein n=2 Tax=Geothermobacter hydrogeniphilus TaxID=1969733 RepID=A0A2K2HBZ6_9BACT|nr:hypothetical protein C2E25_05540 [Geothermobacter hydrogeniphilus]